MTIPTRGKLLRLAAGAMLAATLTSVPALAQKMGGDAVVGQQAQPPTLDVHVGSSEATRNITLHIFESLFTRDEDAVAKPELAESFELADDGLSGVFKIRQGVKFHNGKTMTATDVVASLERFRGLGDSKQILEGVDKIEEVDAHTVKMTFKRVDPTFIERFSSPRTALAIIPAENAGAEANKLELVGTGPFKFVEFQPDSHVKLERFDDYASNENYDERSGFTGKKVPYLDTVTFRFIPEAGARTAGLETGELHALDVLDALSAKRLESNPDVTIYEHMPWSLQTIFFNAANPPTDNPKIRRAIQIALDMEEIMAISTNGLYGLSGGWQHTTGQYNAGDIGNEFYNVKDIDGAKALIKEAGYNGEEIVFITDNAFRNHESTAITATEQLKKLGLNVRIQTADWPTTRSLRGEAKGWNMVPISVGTEPWEGPYGVALIFTAGNPPITKVKDPELEQIRQRLVSSPKFEDRKAAFADFQRRMYEINIAIKVGDIGKYSATTSNLKGYAPYRIPRMWNVWFE